MKNIFSILLFIATIVAFNSCSEDFLEKHPTDALSAEVFYDSKNSIDLALTSCYATLQNSMYTTNACLFDCLSDNAQQTHSGYNTTDIARGPITPTIGGYVNDIYFNSYKEIARYNIFLKTLSDYEGDDITDAIRAQYEAEVRLLRAIRYFELYKFYGDVPLVTEPVTIEEQYQPKVGADQVLNQINADIDFAVSNLPDKAFYQNNGHFVKSSAQVIKARVLMFDAYDDGGVAKSAVMSEVKSITNDIISKNYYDIAPSFRGLFAEDLGEQNNNKEVIFYVNYLAPDNFASCFGWSRAATHISNGSGERVAVLPEFANTFEFNDGTPFSTSNPLYNPDNVYENRDPRMYKTMFSFSVTFEDGFVYNLNSPSTGYTYYKGIMSSDTQDQSEFDKTDGSDWPLMRFAEVLLMYAEAANEVDGPTAQVYDAINRIRARADIQMPAVPQGLGKDEMRNAIRHERRIELAFEGFRYDDVKRWKIAEDVLNISPDGSIYGKSFVKKNYHFPFPQSEIDRNYGALVQNPDYN
ncbi:RagB/SusD family nutrient uptake outer membrane protein [Prolixibacteraceae bacterium Z1-6]|uniref:RagB/SusD family nutrient uptake outer membrane protein n=1 Tax=Draconibacterium aestuarii TaxID=2998507 RepID=A0A9X3F2L1_9BACT|nr:RagB/SusD family nutrient uptake outer membrane protein [Prolixibacteraceae bacterium Z1-6]